MENQTNTQNENAFMSYFNFRKLKAIGFIKILYAIGVICSVLFFLYSLFTLFSQQSQMGAFGMSLPFYTYLIPFGIIIVFNIFWRLLCEGWIVLFKISDTLDKIERNTQK